MKQPRRRTKRNLQKKGKNFLLFFVNFCFAMVLGTGISILLGYYSMEELSFGLEEILIYTVIGVALLLIHIFGGILRKRASQ